MSHSSWCEEVARQVTYAFQPIVNTRTGVCLGYEALLRDWERAGFSSIAQVFDQAAAKLELHDLDLRLREAAISAFARIPHSGRVKLFYNLDNRLLDMPNYGEGKTLEIVERHGVQPREICFEVSERHALGTSDSSRLLLDRYKRQLFKIALDDFGSGFSGLQQLYHCQPDYIKLDRFFMADVARDPRKRLFVSTVVTMAHLLGTHVICEGIETEDELRVCRDLSVDFVQGFLIQRPTTDTDALLHRYPQVADSARRERRKKHWGRILSNGHIEKLPPVDVDEPMARVFDRLKEPEAPPFICVVDSNSEPLGIIRERDLKKYVYTPYGWALLAGQKRQSVREFVVKCPTVEHRSRIEHVMEVFALAPEATEGVIVTEGGKYVGFLPTARLLRAANDRRMALAREQNPLTGLPGNSRINEYLAEALGDDSSGHAFVYFDFDNFKPFNDTYGFRRGDRAIQLFGSILTELGSQYGSFVGHIGGDDFFCGVSLPENDSSTAIKLARSALKRFSSDVESLYEPVDRMRGWIRAVDRHGNEERFPLLGLSAGIAHVPRGQQALSSDDIGSLVSSVKKCAKQSDDHLAILEVLGPATLPNDGDARDTDALPRLGAECGAAAS